MQYRISDDQLEIIEPGLESSFPIEGDVGVMIEDYFTQQSQSNNAQNIISIVLGGLLAFLFIRLRFPLFAILAAVAFLFPALQKTWRQRKIDRQIDDLLAFLETDPKYLILREIGETQKSIDEETERLKKLQHSRLSTQQIIANASANHLKESELNEYQSTLEHLSLRVKLRKAKIEFYKKYLDRMRVRKAIFLAENAILEDSKQEKNGLVLKDLEQLKDEVLELRPLADQMRLCDSEERAKQLIVALKNQK